MNGFALPLGRQFTLAYLLCEVGLIALALATGRMACDGAGVLLELQTGLFCVAMVASCGALGGLCLRMAAGLVAGGVFAVASIPLFVLLISAATR
jgi:hypothetical protein